MGRNKVAPNEGGDGGDGSLSARKYTMENMTEEGDSAVRLPVVHTMGENPGEENGGETNTENPESGAVTPRTAALQKKLALCEQHMNKSKFMVHNAPPGMKGLKLDRLGSFEGENLNSISTNKLAVPAANDGGEVDEAEHARAVMMDEAEYAKKMERRRKRKERHDAAAARDKSKLVNIEDFNRFYRTKAKEKITMENLPADVLEFLSVDYFKKLKYLSIYINAAAFTSIILMIAVQELTWRESNYDWSVYTIILKVMITFVCLVLCCLLYYKYHLLVKQLVMQNRLPKGTSLLGTPKLLRMLLLEVIVCFYHVPPGCHFTFTLDGVRYPADIFGILMFVRLYVLGDAIKAMSGIFRFNSSFFGSFTAVKLSQSFGLKTALNRAPTAVISSLFTLLLLCLSWSVYLCERNYNFSLENYWDALWMTFITMMTVGYGDVVPITHFGRLVTFVTAISGVLMLCLTASIVFKKVELTLDEHRVTDMLEKAKWNSNRRGAAQKVIKRAWELYVCKNPMLNGGNKYNAWIIHRKVMKLFSTINNFRTLKRANPFAERADMRSQMNAILEVKQKQGDLMIRLKTIEGRMRELMRELVGVDEKFKSKGADEEEKTYNEFKLPNEFIPETEKMVIVPQSAPDETDPRAQESGGTLDLNFDSAAKLKHGEKGKATPGISVLPKNQ